MNAHNNREALRQEIANGNPSPQGYRARFIRHGKTQVLLTLAELAFEFNQAYGSYDCLTLQDQIDILATTTQTLKEELQENNNTY